MRIVVAGGTGFIGAPLVRSLVEEGNKVTVLTRGVGRVEPRNGVTEVGWDGQRGGEWEAVIAGADAVINLAGASVAARRWSKAFKRELYESRVRPTRAIVAAIAKAAQRPAVLLNGSAIGYYGLHEDELLEESASPGNDFLAQLTVDWEAEARRAEALDVRVVLLRTGIVLGHGDGPLAKLRQPFRFFVGGPIGWGEQWYSWIHRDDELGLIRFALADDRVRGPFNLTAPEPVRARDLARELGRVLGRPAWAPVPGPILRLAIGEFAAYLLTGQRVVPAAAQRLGYPFRYPTLSAALRELFPSNEE
ncbi:MAG: TIGR01777 family protein [Chloroflexi bacterium]|nr:TIGR01777 family protein [Chloroflexota bacterium]